MARYASPVDQIEKREKRRMGLMLLNIALAAYLGSQFIVESGVPLIAYMGTDLFSRL
jgi:hypothetical protein